MKKALHDYGLVAFSAVTLLFVGLHLGGFQLAVSFASEEFRLDKTGMGLLVGALNLSIILAPLLSGALADRLGKKPLLLFASLCLIAGCVTAGVSRVLAPYVVGIFLIGCGGSVSEAITSAAISDRYPVQSNRLINLCQFFFSAGAIAGPMLIRGIRRAGGSWRLLYAMVGVAAAVLLPALLALHLTRAPAARTRMGNPLRFLRAPAYAMLFAGIVIYVGLENGFGYFAGSLFDLGLGAAELGAFAVSAFWAGTAISRLVNSFVAIPVPRLVLLHFLASAAGLLVMAVSPLPALSLAVSFLVGYSYGPIWSGLMALAAGEFPDQSAGAVGLMSTGCGIGGALYPVCMGAMADHMDIHIPFLFLGVTALAGALLALLYLRRRRAP